MEGAACGDVTQATLLAETVWDGPPAALAAPPPAAGSTWQLRDFFSLTDADEVVLKKQIAQKLGIHYGIANQDKPFADDFAGIKAYTVDGITAATEAIRKTNSRTPTS